RAAGGEEVHVAVIVEVGPGGAASESADTRPRRDRNPRGRRGVGERLAGSGGRNEQTRNSSKPMSVAPLHCTSPRRDSIVQTVDVTEGSVPRRRGAWLHRDSEKDLRATSAES